jgi:hypothetical protein
MPGCWMQAAPNMPDPLCRSKPETGRRYLLVVRAGDDSLHRSWIDANKERNFDLLISYYGTEQGRYQSDGEYYHVLAGPRWTTHHAILRDNPRLRETYDYICFACDDLDADAATWNALFAFCERHGFDLAQPAIIGPVSYAITAPVPDLLYRITNFVEVMCPVFSKRALAVCYPGFGDSVSGWGLNHVWPRLLAKHQSKLAIIDSICVTHTRALREGSLYKVIEDLGIDPAAELASIMARNGIEHADIRELSRVRIASDIAEKLTRVKPNTGRRFLLVVRAGDNSLHPNWIIKNSERKFDLLVSYFGGQEGRYQNDGEYYHVRTGPAWPAYHEIIRDNPHLREGYDYVGFADDDLDADMATWNALFAFCHRHGFELSQPSILGPVSYPITAPVPGLLYRLTTFVEIMCPVFSRRALSICYPSFGESVSGWGINHIWPRLLAKHGGKLAIIDSISVTHTRALGSGSLYKLLDGRGIDPTAEMASVMARNGIEGPDIREVSRVHATRLNAILYKIKMIARSPKKSFNPAP